MSQITQLRRVRVHGSIYLGDETLPDETVVPIFSGDPDRVMNWLSDGFRVRFNQHRSKRSRYLTSVDREGNMEKVADPDGAPILIPIGATVIDLTDRQARQRYSFLAAAPAMVLQAPERIENTDWFAATKRRKTNASNGANAGSMPGFRSRKHSDQKFVCWFNGGSNAVFRKTGKRSGAVIVTGKNPPGLVAPDGTVRWRVVWHVRLSQDICPYTSVRVNWTRREVVFVNAPLPVSRREMNGSAVGLDRGVAHAVADSDGGFYDMPDTSHLDKRRKWHQKRMAKSRVTAIKQARPFWESRRYQEHKTTSAMLSAKIARINRDSANNISTQIVREYDFVGTEALKIASMTRRARGNGVAAKRGLNRAMRDSRLGLINSLIEYKCVASGVPLCAENAKGGGGV